MFTRFISSILIVTSAFVIAFGQDKKEDGDRSPRTFAFTMDGGGSYLGVQTSEITKDNYSKFNLSGVRGVAVEKVSENSPASAAGIQAGDVIVRLDGEEVTGVRKLTRLVSEVDPDHQVRLTVSRNGREQEITATLAKRPAPKFEEGSFPGMQNFKFEMPDMKDMPQFKEMPDLKNIPEGQHVWTFPGGEGRSMVLRSGRGIGVSILPLTKQLADRYQVAGGALVSEVRDGSAAAKAGLRAGDVITEVDGKQIKNQFDIIKAVNDKKDGDVSVTFIRDGKRQTVNVTPEKTKDNGFLFNTDDDDSGSLLGPRLRDMLSTAFSSIPSGAWSLASWM
jgi:serine protease Do